MAGRPQRHNGTTWVDISPSAEEYDKQIPRYGATAGTANAKTVTVVPAFASYFAGLTITINNNLVNTGATTINVNGKGVKSIVQNGNVALKEGDLPVGIHTIVYDGINFILQGKGGGSGDTIGTIRENRVINNISYLDLLFSDINSFQMDRRMIGDDHYMLLQMGDPIALYLVVTNPSGLNTKQIKIMDYDPNWKWTSMTSTKEFSITSGDSTYGRTKVYNYSGVLLRTLEAPATSDRAWILGLMGNNFALSYQVSTGLYRIIWQSNYLLVTNVTAINAVMSGHMREIFKDVWVWTTSTWNTTDTMTRLRYYDSNFSQTGLRPSSLISALL